MEKRIKFCPRCGSDKIIKQIYSSAAIGAPQPFKCEECSLQSDIFPEINKTKLKLIQKEIKNDRKKSKIKILGISKDEHRSIFSFQKEQKLFGIIRNILMKLGFKEDVFEFGCLVDKEPHYPVKDKKGHIKEGKIKNYNEKIFNFSNQDYSVDIIFFSKKVSLIFNYKKDKQEELSKVFEGILEE